MAGAIGTRPASSKLPYIDTICIAVPRAFKSRPNPSGYFGRDLCQAEVDGRIPGDVSAEHGAVFPAEPLGIFAGAAANPRIP